MAVHNLHYFTKVIIEKKKLQEVLGHFVLEVPRHTVVQICHRFFAMPKTQEQTIPSKNSVLNAKKSPLSSSVAQIKY